MRLAPLLLGLVMGCAHRASETPPLVVVAAGDVAPPAINQNERTAKLVESLSPVAVLVAGDTQYDQGLAVEYEAGYAPTWGRFLDKTWAAPGNHEYKSGAQGYFDYFGARAGPDRRGYYSVDVGDWHVISLNTGHLCASGACAEGSAQYEWLKADLAGTTKKCVVAFFHHPRFTDGHHGDFTPVDPLWRLLASHNVELVINGHEHLYERFAPMNADGQLTPDGTTEVVVGTGGITMAPPGHGAQRSVARQHTAWGVLKLSLWPTRWQAEFLSVPGGEVFSDSFGGVCR